MNKLKTGQRVKRITTGTVNYMRNGIITGIDKSIGRVYVLWPQHGPSSIPIDQIEVEEN